MTCCRTWMALLKWRMCAHVITSGPMGWILSAAMVVLLSMVIFVVVIMAFSFLVPTVVAFTVTSTRFRLQHSCLWRRHLWCSCLRYGVAVLGIEACGALGYVVEDCGAHVRGVEDVLLSDVVLGFLALDTVALTFMSLKAVVLTFGASRTVLLSEMVLGFLALETAMGTTPALKAVESANVVTTIWIAPLTSILGLLRSTL
ncbi:hypothetical protein PHYPSEUDO_006658 [Phytophthora pseudosyringae]|uniref:Transmembrane protein n=1 Tax=Phytophthora pseudosyringae TaxID=221518 RepID=A0A8T1WBW9_9STRA|nr:hypothetical protein PHYPSEUDO_006658 [Phytophthora pseudosyringae]